MGCVSRYKEEARAAQLVEIRSLIGSWLKSVA